MPPPICVLVRCSCSSSSIKVNKVTFKYHVLDKALSCKWIKSTPPFLPPHRIPDASQQSFPSQSLKAKPFVEFLISSRALFCSLLRPSPQAKGRIVMAITQWKMTLLPKQVFVSERFSNEIYWLCIFIVLPFITYAAPSATHLSWKVDVFTILLWMKRNFKETFQVNLMGLDLVHNMLHAFVCLWIYKGEKYHIFLYMWHVLNYAVLVKTLINWYDLNVQLFMPCCDCLCHVCRGWILLWFYFNAIVIFIYLFILFFFDMSIQEWGERIQTSDLYFIRCSPSRLTTSWDYFWFNIVRIILAG